MTSQRGSWLQTLHARLAFSGRAAPHAAALFAAVVVLAMVWIVDVGERDRYRREHYGQVLAQVSASRAKLEQALNSRLYLTHAMAAFVAAQPRLDEAQLEAYARGLLVRQPSNTHLALADGSIVSFVYPQLNQTLSVGSDLLSGPTQSAVWRAFQGKHFVLAGPVDLAPGRPALVGCLPVFLPAATPGGPERFWGLALILVELDPLLDEAGLLQPLSDLRWALRGTDGWGELGETFFGNGAVFESEPAKLDVALPTGSWQLAAVPAGGWATTSAAAWWIRVGGVLVTSLVSLLVFMLVHDPVRLREKVREATAALREREEQLELRVKDRTHELASLLDVSHAVASTLQMDTLVGLILEQLGTVVEYTGLRVWRVEGDEMVVLADRGRPAGPIGASRAPGRRIPLSERPLHKLLVERRVPVIIGDVRLDDTPEAVALRTSVGVELATSPGFPRSWMGIPMVVRDTAIGLLGIGHAEPHLYTPAKAALALAFANQAAIAMENARLYEQARDKAALEERQRLARELHDSVTQTLFSASLIAEVLPRLTERSPEMASGRLQELRELTRGALAEMRTLLLELRPAALTEVSLVDLLRQLAESVIGSARLPVSLTVEGTPSDPVPPDVQIAVYRISQEALNNVVKHSGATQAAIELSWLPDGIEVCVADNGRGFDPAQIAGGRLGVAGMQERAAGIGAELAVRSRAGEGAEVLVTWHAAARLEAGVAAGAAV